MHARLHTSIQRKSLSVLARVLTKIWNQSIVAGSRCKRSAMVAFFAFLVGIVPSAVWADFFGKPCLPIDRTEHVETLNTLIDLVDFTRNQSGSNILPRLDDALDEQTSLINEPVFRLLYSYGYLQDGNFLGAYANSEIAERLSLRRSDCNVMLIIDMAQSVRFSAINGLKIQFELENVFFESIYLILPSSEEMNISETRSILCQGMNKVLETGLGSAEIEGC